MANELKQRSYEMRIFDNPNGTKIEEYEKQKKLPYGGYVYILEWGDIGVKIGCTSNLSKRMLDLTRSARYGALSLGRVAVTPEHTNYRENERILHDAMDDDRVVHTELFELSLEEVLDRMPDLEYKDESERIEKRVEWINNQAIKFVSGAFNDVLGLKSDVCGFDDAITAMLEDPEMCIERVYKTWLYHVERADAAMKLMGLLEDYKNTKWRSFTADLDITENCIDDE